jgi:tRNA dimethylallyltransferase
MNASAEKRLQELIETRTVVVIAGPTASGKTAVSLELAHYINAEIISADSRQIFKYLDIGTAKATAEERSSAPHHFIDIVEPDEYYSAGIFGKQALDTVNEIFSRNALPLIVGGSGLYIKALCEGFFEEEQKTPPEIKSELEQRFKNEGIEPLYEELKQFDQLSAELYRDKNPRRIL